MARYLFTSLRIALLTMVIVGIMYPLLMTGLAQILFRDKANGSLVYDGKILKGSTLIGQAFTGAGYFHSRPSAAGNGYDAMASGNSNLGPTSAILEKRVTSDVQKLHRENPGLTDIPVDMVTTSASGLDPDITPASAYAQVPRIAKERKMQESLLRNLVERHVQRRQFGLLGEPRVNVLQLNQALDIIPGASKP